MNHHASLLLQRLAALVLTGVFLGLVAAAIVEPPFAAYNARAVAEERLAARRAASLNPEPVYIAADLYREASDTGAAATDLQVRFGGVLGEVGVAATSIQPLAPEHLSPTAGITWMELQLAADLGDLARLLQKLDQQRPLFLVRSLSIRPSARNNASLLDVTMEIGSAWSSEPEAA